MIVCETITDTARMNDVLHLQMNALAGQRPAWPEWLTIQIRAAIG